MPQKSKVSNSVLEIIGNRPTIESAIQSRNASSLLTDMTVLNQPEKADLERKVFRMNHPFFGALRKHGNSIANQNCGAIQKANNRLPSFLAMRKVLLLGHMKARKGYFERFFFFFFFYGWWLSIFLDENAKLTSALKLVLLRVLKMEIYQK